VGKLEDIAARNERALRDTRNRLVWVGVIVAALVAIGIGVAAGYGKPKVPPRQPQVEQPTPGPADHVDGVLLRRSTDKR
jgi:hypothetical protein